MRDTASHRSMTIRQFHLSIAEAFATPEDWQRSTTMRSIVTWLLFKYAIFT